MRTRNRIVWLESFPQNHEMRPYSAWDFRSIMAYILNTDWEQFGVPCRILNDTDEHALDEFPMFVPDEEFEGNFLTEDVDDDGEIIEYEGEL